MRYALVPIVLLALAGASAPPDRQSAAATELTTTPGALVEAEVEGKPVRLQLRAGGPDRLILNGETVARLGIKRADFFGSASFSVAGRREFKGESRPLDFVIGGMKQKGRAFWFTDAPPQTGDGSIGPLALPQARLRFDLGPAAADQKLYAFPYYGAINGQSLTAHELSPGLRMGVSFDLEETGPYPIASAAAGAVIANDHGGTVSGASWDVEIIFGVKRPVRLMTLERPFVFGPFAFRQIAVRVRNRVDAAGHGADIPEAGAVEDPSEVVVTANAKGVKPVHSFAIPRAAFAPCSTLLFDKAAKTISVMCRPAV
ncbi:hypothetical protein [Sphingomonas sp.]|uniref:hypothetical protein n=1 Tax=Sphingomonas sp. TaxID=28214 RepID=UPI001D1DFE97|nr:hypothetical protein [Sphingomonas sp.]MBX9796119.1 hypothetical protein [Sphingomonas sp.]